MCNETSQEYEGKGELKALHPWNRTHTSATLSSQPAARGLYSYLESSYAGFGPVLPIVYYIVLNRIFTGIYC